MDGPSPKKKAKATDLPVCPYGSRCYRKNPQHFKEFSHADDDNKPSSSKPKDALSLVDSTSLPVCKYGANCYRKNLLHFAEFSHPTAVTSTDMTDSGNDTDPLSDDDTDNKKKSPKKKVKDVDILKRGVSLVKNYSQMSEEERKELIKKAMAAKKQLEEELEATKNEVKKKDKELNRLQKEVAAGALLMEGEKEAMEGNKVVYFDLFPERSYKEGSAAQTHFRLAESQFYRLISGSGNNYTVTKVQYAVNPPLVKQFHESMEDLKKQRGEELSFPVLAFHGTEQKNIKPIVENNFKVPGSKSSGNIQLNFCVKREEAPNREVRDWPKGDYCIPQYSGCPEGFSSGYVRWDTKANSYSRCNQASGYYPSGTYSTDIMMNFCCRNDSDSLIPITLPRDQPFYLVRNNGSKQCQQVNGMTSKEEYITWDNANNSQLYKNYKITSDIHPLVN
ncbi:Hypothetical predicted protein, partial [Mytilus galloprovincialis]